MPDIVSDANTRVSWVPTIANIAAPTVAELNTGVALESWVTPDGLETSVETQTVDNTALNSNQNTALVGRRSDDVSVTFKQQGKTLAPWTTFAGTPNGFLVRRSGIAASTAWQAGQRVTVYTVQAGYRNEMSPAANELEKFSVDFVVSGGVRDDAIVA